MSDQSRSAVTNDTFGPILKDIRRALEISANRQMDPVFDALQATAWSRQLSMRRSMEELTSKALPGLCRFGVGEFRIMANVPKGCEFQTSSEDLCEELRLIFGGKGAPYKRPLLIGFPHPYRDLYWSKVWSEVWHVVSSLVSEYDGSFANSHITRPIFFEQFREEGVLQWSSLFRGQRICVVTGEGSRHKTDSRLLSEATSVKSILGPSRDAYEVVDDLMREIVETSDSVDLFVAALGPAGTVIAARCAALGIRCLDIGHITASEDAALRNGVWPDHRPIHSGGTRGG